MLMMNISEIFSKLNIGSKYLNLNKRCFFYILDWEEMINEPRLDMYPLNYDDANHTGT